MALEDAIAQLDAELIPLATAQEGTVEWWRGRAISLGASYLRSCNQRLLTPVGADIFRKNVRSQLMKLETPDG